MEAKEEDSIGSILYRWKWLGIKSVLTKWAFTKTNILLTSIWNKVNEIIIR